MLLGCLLVAGVLSPWLTARATRATEVTSAAARAEMSDAALTVLEDSAGLRVSGQLPAQLARLQAAEDDLAAAVDRGARPLATSAALANAALGVAVLGAILLGVPAAGAGPKPPSVSQVPNMKSPASRSASRTFSIVITGRPLSAISTFAPF